MAVERPVDRELEDLGCGTGHLGALQHHRDQPLTLDIGPRAADGAENRIHADQNVPELDLRVATAEVEAPLGGHPDPVGAGGYKELGELAADASGHQKMVCLAAPPRPWS